MGKKKFINGLLCMAISSSVGKNGRFSVTAIGKLMEMLRNKVQGIKVKKVASPFFALSEGCSVLCFYLSYVFKRPTRESFCIQLEE